MEFPQVKKSEVAAAAAVESSNLAGKRGGGGSNCFSQSTKPSVHYPTLASKKLNFFEPGRTEIFPAFSTPLFSRAPVKISHPNRGRAISPSSLLHYPNPFLPQFPSFLDNNTSCYHPPPFFPSFLQPPVTPNHHRHLLSTLLLRLLLSPPLAAVVVAASSPFFFHGLCLCSTPAPMAAAAAVDTSKLSRRGEGKTTT